MKRHAVTGAVIWLWAGLCGAAEIHRTFPAAEVVRDQFVVVASASGMTTIPAHSTFADGTVTVSAQLDQLPPDAMVSVVVRYESGELRSTVFERPDQPELNLDPAKIAEQSERALSREIEELKQEQAVLQAQIEAAHRDLRMRAGFEKVDEINRAIARVQHEIDRIRRAP